LQTDGAATELTQRINESIEIFKVAHIRKQCEDRH